MLETSQPWTLFGYDLRKSVHYFRAGWSDFLWGSDSRVFQVIDEVVKVYDQKGEIGYFKAGRLLGPDEASGQTQTEAMVIPEQLTLCKELSVPAAAEADLGSVMSLEVAASSPFPEADTSRGWLITNRREQDFDVQLVISSQSAIMAFIAEKKKSHDVQAYEVWAQVDGHMVMLEGFGEAGRQQRNRRRLFRMGAIGAYCLAALMLMFALGAAAKYLELQKVQAMQAQVTAAAGDAVELRSSLASSKSMIGYINEQLAGHPSSHRELKRLASILGDDTWLGAAEISGSTIKIEGESTDASAVMQLLLDHPAYSRVVAPVAIKKVRSGMERFVLNLTLTSEGESE